MEPAQIGIQRRFRIRSKRGTALDAFGAFDNPGGKHHTCGLPACLAVGFGQKSQDIYQFRPRGGLRTGFDLIPPIPGIVNFPLEPFDNFSGFRLVLERVDRNFATVNRNELALGLESDRRRILQIFKTAQKRIQVRQGI